MPNDEITASRGYMVHGSGDLVRASRGYAVTTTNETVIGHLGYLIGVNPEEVRDHNGIVVAKNADENVSKTTGVVVMQSFYPPWGALTLDVEFIDRRFPDKIGYGSKGGPGFKTSVFRMDSGRETSSAEWDRIRARYTVEYAYATGNDVEDVENFFYGMRGKAIGFRFKDWTDYQITNQIIGVGDGATTLFQLFKRYESGGYYFDRIIKKPVRNTINRVYVDDEELQEFTGFGINYSTGAVKLAAAPAAGTVITIDYIEFDVPVRFDTDELTVQAQQHDQFQIMGLDMIEVIV